MSAVWMLSLLPIVASAQTNSANIFTDDHPLVYEDAWDLWPYSFLNEEGGYHPCRRKLSRS